MSNYLVRYLRLILGLTLAACTASPSPTPPAVTDLPPTETLAPTLTHPLASPTPTTLAVPTATDEGIVLTPQGLTATATLRATAASTSPALLTAQRVPILEYHHSTYYMTDTVMMTTAWFQAQLQWLADHHFTTLTDDQLAEFVEGTYAPPEPAAVLTFDIGTARSNDYATVIIPALRQHQFHAIFFVVTSQISDTCDGKQTCWSELSQWQAEGLISVGSHTLYHEDYATLSPAAIVRDAGRSKTVIEEKLGQPVLGFGYPFDSVNPAAFELLAKLGYRFAMAGYTRPDRSAHFHDPAPFNLARYYPYSGEKTYPIITGSGGLTFAEMMTQATGP